MKTRKVSSSVNFKDIPRGACFSVGKKVYLKIQIADEFLGASIITGESKFLKDDTKCNLLSRAIFEY